ncbi:MAG: hypothetical protein KBB46_03045 [Candidatus Pacebacteria bacterium]|nr:hypothetical protein [Candidatus Paceibacterota bacterium]
MRKINGLPRERAKAKRRMEQKILSKKEKRDFEVVVQWPGYKGLRRKEDVV